MNLLKQAIFSAFCALVVTLGVASADHVSTFTTTGGDVLISGFSIPDLPNPPIPTGGPLVIDMSNQVGSYDLDIPTVGSLWTVFVEGETIIDLGAGPQTLPVPLTNLGVLASPGPGSLPSWSGSGLLPDFLYTPLAGPDVTISGVTLDFVFDTDSLVYPSGPYGPNASTLITLSGGNLNVITADLTGIDNLLGGANGIITGTNSGNLTITLVPEPTMYGLTVLGLMGLVASTRRRRHRQ